MLDVLQLLQQQNAVNEQLKQAMEQQREEQRVAAEEQRVAMERILSQLARQENLHSAEASIFAASAAASTSPSAGGVDFLADSASSSLDDSTPIARSIVPSSGINGVAASSTAAALAGAIPPSYGTANVGEPGEGLLLQQVQRGNALIAQLTRELVQVKTKMGLVESKVDHVEGKIEEAHGEQGVLRVLTHAVVELKTSTYLLLDQEHLAPTGPGGSQSAGQSGLTVQQTGTGSVASGGAGAGAAGGRVSSGRN